MIDNIEDNENAIILLRQFNKGEIYADTTFKIQRQILAEEIGDEVFLFFAVVNFKEMMWYVAMENLNIRIHRNIPVEM